MRRGVEEKAFKYDPLLKLPFKEQNPGPIKYCMTRQGFVAGSPTVPVCGISKGLGAKPDAMKKPGIL